MRQQAEDEQSQLNTNQQHTDPTKQEVSFRRRYLFKVMTNLAGLGIGLITQAIVPRALGPSSYGNYSFINSFFSQYVGFLNLNSSTAFYTKLSQRQNETELVGFYSYFVLLIGLCLGLLLTVSSALGLKALIWPGQMWVFIIIGAIWAFFSFYTMILSDMSDAYGLTVKSETAKMVLKVVGLVAVLIMFWQGWLNLFNYFSYQTVILILLTILCAKIVKKAGFPSLRLIRMSKAQILLYVGEFKKFCLPLLTFTAAAVIEQMSDRWFIQKFSGSVMQGFYGLAYQVGSICFLFTSATIPLVLREQAISFGLNDFDRMRRSFTDSVNILYCLTAFFSCFIAVEASAVLSFFGGQAYAGALVPLTIMCFFPIHQTYGQINGNFFFATERVKLYRNIGMIFIVPGLISNCILMGPKSFGALQLGAIGLAIKMVCLQIASVNVQLWYNTKYLRLPFKRFVYHQVVVVLLFLSGALITSNLIHVLFAAYNPFIQFLLSGLVYAGSILALLFLRPEICGLRRQDVLSIWSYLRLKYESIRW